MSDQISRKEIEKSIEIGKIIFHEDQMKLSINRLNQMMNETIEEVKVDTKADSVAVGNNMVFINASDSQVAFNLDLSEKELELKTSDSFNEQDWILDNQDFLSLIEKIKFIHETKSFLDDYKGHAYFNQK